MMNLDGNSNYVRQDGEFLDNFDGADERAA
jgi:hypothetical protein